jgi:hypothetical protein
MVRVLENTGVSSATRSIKMEHMFDTRCPLRQCGRRAHTSDGNHLRPCAPARFTATTEDDPVGQKTVRFSDLSGQLMLEDDVPARIVVCEHPELADGPVEIEALLGEAAAIEGAAVQVAVVELYVPGDDQPRRVAMEADAFDKLATDKPMTELLAAARPARRAPRSSAASAPRDSRINYATLEHAGQPHKGKTTDEEKRLVREHLDEINERLAAQRLRTISLTNPEHVERYGLEHLAAEQLAGDQLARDQLMGEQLAGDQLAGDQLAGDQQAGEQLAGDRLTDAA